MAVVSFDTAPCASRVRSTRGACIASITEKPISGLHFIGLKRGTQMGISSLARLVGWHRHRGPRSVTNPSDLELWCESSSRVRRGWLLAASDPTADGV